MNFLNLKTNEIYYRFRRYFIIKGSDLSSEYISTHAKDYKYYDLKGLKTCQSELYTVFNKYSEKFEAMLFTCFAIIGVCIIALIATTLASLVLWLLTFILNDTITVSMTISTTHRWFSEGLFLSAVSIVGSFILVMVINNKRVSVFKEITLIDYLIDKKEHELA